MTGDKYLSAEVAAKVLSPPDVDPELLKVCRAKDDFCEVLFVPYQAAMHLCGFLANLAPLSECVEKIPALHYSLLTGFLARCARLMSAITHLSEDGTYGEITTILDRCIFETSIKVQWLCAKRNDDSFDRLIRDGLKSDVKMRAQIEQNIAERGSTWSIEQRMLESIDALFKSANVSVADITDSPKLPDLSAMIRDIGWSNEFYLAGQRMGSHHVHGTWASLMRDYLIDDEEGVHPRPFDEPRFTQDVQYRFSMLLVLDALLAFVDYVVRKGEDRITLLSAINAHRDLLAEIYDRKAGIADEAVAQ